MAKKKRRNNDARLKVIAGGAGPKAVVAKPARAPKIAEPNVRRPAKPLPPVEETAYDRVSAVESLPVKAATPPFPRWVVPVGILAVVGVVAWALLSKSVNPAPAPAAIPPPTAFSTTAWPAPSPVVSAPEGSTPLPEVVAPSASVSSAPSAAPTPSAAPAVSAPPVVSAAPVVSAPPAVSAPKPKPAAPKAPPTANDDPYQ